MKTKKITGFKFIQKDMKSKNGNLKWKIGEWVHEDELKMCEKGLHACINPLDSLEYIYGDRWFVVEARGEIIRGEDKFVATDMRLVKELPIEILQRFAIRCASRAVKKYWNKKSDKRPDEAIEAAEAYLDNPTKENLVVLKEKTDAARSAARSAAESTAWSAWSAAWSAWSAAWSAWSTAWSAESAAESTAWSAAERKWQNDTLKKLIREYLKGC